MSSVKRNKVNDWRIMSPRDMAAFAAFLRQIILDGCEFDYRTTGDATCRVTIVTQPESGMFPSLESRRADRLEPRQVSDFCDDDRWSRSKC